MRSGVLMAAMFLASACQGAATTDTKKTENERFSADFVESSVEIGSVRLNRQPQDSAGLIIYVEGGALHDPKGSAEYGGQGLFLRQTGEEKGFNLLNIQVIQRSMDEEFDHLLADQLLDLIENYRVKNAYKKIILAGRAYGGWIVLKAAGQDRFSLIDGIAVSSFSKYGPSIFADGSRNENFAKLMPASLKLADSVTKTRTVVSCFNNDPWEPKNRCYEMAEILKKNEVPHTIIDRPKWIEGHSGFARPIFGHTFGECARDLLLDGEKNSCEEHVQTENPVKSKTQNQGPYRNDPLPIPYATTEITLSKEAKGVFNGYYAPQPMIQYGKYYYKYFFVSPSTGKFHSAAGHLKYRPIRVGLRDCGEPDCVVYAEGNVVYPKQQ